MAFGSCDGIEHISSKKLANTAPCRPTSIPPLWSRFSYYIQLGCRNPAASINLGREEGGLSSSIIDGPGLPSGGLPGSVVLLPCVSDSPMPGIAFQCLSMVQERKLASVLGVIVCSAIGDAITIVPATAIGGGRGLLGLNGGRIKSCIEDLKLSSPSGSDLAYDGDVGLEVLGGLEASDSPKAVPVSYEGA